MRIATNRSDYVKALRFYAECLEHRAKHGHDDPGKLIQGAEMARDWSNDLAALDLWDSAISWRADA